MEQTDLKQKTIKSLFWSFTDNFMTQGANFLVGIILARLLSPKEFGLIGMITIFIILSQVFVDSGFNQALIRKKAFRQEDYSTVFYFNLAVGTLFYMALFFSANAISVFYNEPQLGVLVRVMGLVLFINAASMIHRVILTKNINFKLQTKISIISSTASGVLGVWMAYSGWGVWSLVWKTISQNLIATILLWLWNTWRPALTLSVESFKEMFGFGSKLLAASLIDEAFNNAYYVVVGKFYSASDLGFFSRADQFQKLFTSNMTSVIQRVSYPVLSSIQDDRSRLRNGYKKLIKNSMFLSFFFMFGMAAMSEAMIVTMLGSKWLPAVPYLQLLCFSGVLHPLHALNLNILNVCGRSDLFLQLEIIKKVLMVSTIIIGIYLGIKLMIVSRIVVSILSYFINVFWSGKLIKYPPSEQLRDIVPAFLGATAMGLFLFIVGESVHLNPLMTFFIQCLMASIIAFLFARMFRLEAYLELKELLVAHGLIKMKPRT